MDEYEAGRMIGETRSFLQCFLVLIRRKKHKSQKPTINCQEVSCGLDPMQFYKNCILKKIFRKEREAKCQIEDPDWQEGIFNPLGSGH